MLRKPTGDVADTRRAASLLLAAGLVLLMLVAGVNTPADPDLWGHLTFGRDIITTGHVIQSDKYAFTSDRPWVNHEWLAETSFAETYRLAGSTGLVILKLIVIAALLLAIWWHLRQLQISASARISMIALVFVGTFWRTHAIRPQLFSVLFFAVLLIALTSADRGRRRALFLIPPLMAVWANFHGGWVVGIGILGIWTALRILQRGMRSRERVLLAIVGTAALAATLLNPYGSGMWVFLSETVRLGRVDIEEWRSVLTYPVALGLPWLLMLTAAMLAVWRGKRPRRLDYLAIVGLLAIASFRVNRLDAFFALALLILLAPELASLIASATDRAREKFRGAMSANTAPNFGVLAITVMTIGVMAVPAARIIVPSVACLAIGGPWPPDVDAGRFISLNRLQGRLLTWFDWGEYAIWHFGPKLQVSLDGRRETVYSDATIQAHRRFYAADETALPYLRALNPDFVWLPSRLAVTSQLSAAGWTPVFSSAVSVVFARTGAGPFQLMFAATTSSNSSMAPRCFPDP